MKQEVRFCAASDGVRLAYATLGEGPPLLVAPQWIGHLQFEWEQPEVRGFWGALARGRRLIRFDARGTGLSDWDAADLSFAARVADVGAVADALGLERFDLFGPSMGGATSILYAAEHPERVERLVLYGAYPRLPQGDSNKEMLALVRANWGLASAAMAAANADPDHMGWFVGLQRAATRGEVAARMLEVIHEMDIAPRLTDVRAPTLVVHRKGDRVHPFEFAKEIAAGIADARLEALEGDIYWPWWGDSEALVKVIRGFLGDDTESTEVPTTPTAIERKLTAILSADVVGYSRLMAQDDIATVEQVNASRKTMAEQIQQHGGRVVDAVGDDLLAEFRSVVDAVRSAAAIQRALAEHNDPLEETRRMRWRIGVNLGDVIVQEDRLYGDGVNIAARVQALADPGGIAISGTAHEHVESKLALSFEDLGEHEVKNIPRPVRVYRIVAPREGFGG